VLGSLWIYYLVCGLCLRRSWPECRGTNNEIGDSETKQGERPQQAAQLDSVTIPSVSEVNPQHRFPEKAVDAELLEGAAAVVRKGAIPCWTLSDGALRALPLIRGSKPDVTSDLGPIGSRYFAKFR
jgi:hypothetical protein